MASMDIKVPDIGDFDEVAVIELLVQPGEQIRAEQSLLTVESDKASMEIPSSHAGRVRALHVQVGDKVRQGSLLLTLDIAEGAQPADARAPATPAPAPAPAAAPAVAQQPPAPAAASEESTIEVRVPDIGDFKDVAVIELLARPGERVAAEQSLFTVESDKASMDIPAPAAGVLREFRIALGDKVNIGDLVALIDGAAQATADSAPASAAAPAPSAPARAPAPTPASAAPAAPAPAPAPIPAHQPGAPGAVGADLPHASPSVRKFARELGVPLAEIRGSGAKGRITHEDVQAFTRQVMNASVQTRAQAAAAPAAAAGSGLDLLPWPKVDFAKFGPVERRELSRIKKISGANLQRNWVLIPHVCNHEDADITDLEAFRLQFNRENEKSGVKVTMLAFMIKAAVAALKKFPDFNASLDGAQLVLKNYYHIGFAADTPNGLVVPVIRDADQKGVVQLSQEMAELAKKARDGKLSPADMSGGCFSISSLGGIGGRYFTPIINAPEVAILGVCKSRIEAQWDGRQFAPRLMLPLSLSWDHRVIDGAAAARFNVFFAALLADLRRIVM